MVEQGLRGVEQGRAAFAYEQVKYMAEQVGLRDKYATAAKKVPVLIKTNGLAQTLAFMQNRDEGYNELFEQIDAWLRQKHFIEADSRTDLVEWVIQQPSNAYRHLTTETLALMNWIRRFVDGLIST